MRQLLYRVTNHMYKGFTVVSANEFSIHLLVHRRTELDWTDYKCMNAHNGMYRSLSEYVYNVRSSNTFTYHVSGQIYYSTHSGFTNINKCVSTKHSKSTCNGSV